MIVPHASPAEERLVCLGAGLTQLPERMLLAHARGQILFITGAGTSLSSGLPGFRQLVLDVYEELDKPMHSALCLLGTGARYTHTTVGTGLSHEQRAEIARFASGDFDIVLGMLERRMDGDAGAVSRVRKRISDVLRTVRGSPTGPRPSAIHRALMRLANRGATLTIATTNFDRLLEATQGRRGQRAQTHSLGSIPRPGHRSEFAGVLHIHGALSRHANNSSEMIVSDRDFGEFYLRRRVVPDFIYDAARLFHLVLVGYSANDAPMRYLLNAVAADGSRFQDLKERFAFVGMPTPTDPIDVEDWKGRGITPIPYDSKDSHSALTDCLIRWSELSAINGDQRKVDGLVKRLVAKPRAVVAEWERDLFDHLIRRGNLNERYRLTALVSRTGADHSWLDAILDIGVEVDGGRR